MDDDGTVLVRDNLLLAFFCCRDFHNMADGARIAFESWLSAVPADSLRWSIVGSSASEIKPYSKLALDRCRAMFNLDKAKLRPTSAFKLFGPESDNSSYRFTLSGKIDIEKDKSIDAPTNLIEMRFPAEHLTQVGTAEFVQFAIACARALPYDSGYASLALTPSKQGDSTQIGQLIAGLALRHPGYDVYDNGGARVGLGRRSRGARWLTFLGASQVKKLGGEKALRSILDPAVLIDEAGDGLVLRAGPKPLPGDKNRKKDLPLLRSVAKAIEPITRFNELLIQDFLDDDAEKLERWERRFLD
jgi:hypothetical protein